MDKWLGQPSVSQWVTKKWRADQNVFPTNKWKKQMMVFQQKPGETRNVIIMRNWRQDKLGCGARLCFLFWLWAWRNSLSSLILSFLKFCLLKLECYAIRPTSKCSVHKSSKMTNNKLLLLLSFKICPSCLEVFVFKWSRTLSNRVHLNMEWACRKGLGYISHRASLVPQTVRIHLQCRRLRCNPWVRKIPWRREWQPAPVFLLVQPHGQRDLVGHSPWGLKELNTTDMFPFTFHIPHNLKCLIQSDWSEWVMVPQLCPILCDPMNCNLPGSSVHGIFQVRITGVG